MKICIPIVLKKYSIFLQIHFKLQFDIYIFYFSNEQRSKSMITHFIAEGVRETGALQLAVGCKFIVSLYGNLAKNFKIKNLHSIRWGLSKVGLSIWPEGDRKA